MKSEILRVKSALAGPNATSPTSRMVKVQDQRLWAYGGAFCLSVPITSAMNCGFLPHRPEEFFSSPREGCSITEQDGEVIFKHEKDVVRVKCLPAHEIPSLAAIGIKRPVETPLTHLDDLGKTCFATSAGFHQAVHFKEQMIYAAHQSVCLSVQGLQWDHPYFAIPAAAASALGAVKATLVDFILDRCSAQFEFDDGTILAARLIDGLPMPDLAAVFSEGQESATPVEITEGAVKKLLKFRLKEVSENGVTTDGLWEFQNGDVNFVGPDGATGECGGAYRGNCPAFRIMGENLRRVLEMSSDIYLLTIPGHEEPSRLIGYGDDFAVVSVLRR